MEYQEAKNLRGKKFTNLMTEKLLQGHGVGSSLGKTISEKTKAKVTGIKETFDPMKLSKAVGGDLGAAIYGKVFNRSQKDMQYFTGRGSNKTKEKSNSVGGLEKTSHKGEEKAIEILGFIYELMKKNEENNTIDQEQSKSKLEEQELEEERRNQEIIKAIRGLKRKAKPSKKQKPEPTKEEPTQPPAPGKEAPSAAPPKESPKVPTKEAPTAGVPKGTAKPSLGTAAKVAGGAAIITATGLGSSSAKFESNGNPGSVSSGMMGAGKPDPGGVSYGTYQMSSTKGVADDFVTKSEFKKDFAGLKAGTPEFSSKWKEISSDSKKGKSFADAQHKYIEETHFQPAAKTAKAMGYKIEDPGVADAIWSMAVQHGGWKNVLKISNDIMGGNVNPDPKVEIRSLYQARNQYTKNLGMDLSGRYSAEVDVALNKSQNSKNAPADTYSNVGSKVDVASKENRDLKENLNKSQQSQSTVNNTYSTSQSSGSNNSSEPADDTNPYLKKKKG